MLLRTTLLGISGSLRSNSCNTAILEALRGRLPAYAPMAIFPLNDVPLYNSDLEGDSQPVAVKDLRQSVLEADGLILCSPEYNYGTSGVLKNALDWLSRPAYESPLKGKPTLIMSSSPGPTGGARAHGQVATTLLSALARVTVCQPVIISHVFEKIQDGRFTDERSLSRALDAVGLLLQEVKLFQQ
jgi:chromate reductase